ncbi:dTDP-4-keto-6-deoxy-D-glucose epimerase [Cryobacterium frigoriphilum]|uniref:dTDP-4-keto-6-deoxy-D-glucose epimerase n=1 Tax=Cryobacterium frigoriphilum TaxID=1259150 RepID=A0A4R9A2F3_9MICO|nr:dTDP-4-dehydrorhamnose 3,5-epimerase family protein [Cryobacterium frigoriphilum]TFD50783.1 dTDP-4-keto-6-deoxy-D-glucose epimerase [Cryobacterium frigoriphilum]
MHIRELSIPDAYEITPKQFGDDRGVFLEWYRSDRLEEKIGHRLALAQANTSVSTRGAVRGIHFADVPPSQAKYVTAVHGAVLDFVIDIRIGSPTYGQWDSVLLDDTDRRAAYIAEGLGHCFVALTHNATVSYLVTSPFNPGREHAINPLDPDIGLVFPPEAGELVLSAKDTDAPGLAASAAAGLLPTWDAARAYYETLNSSSPNQTNGGR